MYSQEDEIRDSRNDDFTARHRRDERRDLKNNDFTTSTSKFKIKE